MASDPPPRYHLVLAALTGLALPAYFFTLGADEWGHARLGTAVWGFILSPLVGGVAGFAYGFVLSDTQRRRCPTTPVARIRWSCSAAGCAAGLGAMIIAAFVLASFPSGSRGWGS